MERRGPTLLNLPPPPSDPATPNEMGPGTPNSATTSMSALSVVAIKDGALGHGRGGGHHSSSTLEAERADRISRLAGLERIATTRNPSHLAPGIGGGGGAGGVGGTGPGGSGQYPAGYFDPTPQLKERSTVGSASATGSVAGTRTWASESLDYDADKMSESQDDGVSSVGGVSDEDKSSLVGFGEGAGSTVSGPVSTPSARAVAARSFASATTPRTAPAATGSGQSTPMSGILPSSSGGGGGGGGPDPKMVDGMSYDANIVDTTMQPAPPVYSPQHSNRLSGQGTGETEDSPHQPPGRFAFERD